MTSESPPYPTAPPAVGDALVEDAVFGLPTPAVPAAGSAPISRKRMARAAAQLRRWAVLAQHAHPANTRSAWKSDWAAYKAFCRQAQHRPLPATPDTVSAFLMDRAQAGRAIASLRRYRATIAKAHEAAGFDDPCAAPTVGLALKAAAQARPSRQKQARGLGWEAVKAFLEVAPVTLRDHRDRAFVAVAYDTLCRSAELVQFDVADFELPAQHSGLALVRRSKTDQAGEGQQAFLAAQTGRLLQAWLDQAGVSEGPVFRRVIGTHRLGERLKPPAAGAIFRRLALKAALAPQAREGISGHSTRVGGIQDLLALNCEMPAIQRDARLKDPRMVIRYGERILAARGAMARAAKAQGRL